MKEISRIYEKSLDDDFEKMGLWYQKDSSEYVCGKIRYNDEGIFLDTIFAIDDPKIRKISLRS
ncbi:MAG: hypothetical protein OES34_11585 [Nitrosopumilus sp.]|nr:hypothetical protein [Nitrosopumilus sp.]